MTELLLEKDYVDSRSAASSNAQISLVYSDQVLTCRLSISGDIGEPIKLQSAAELRYAVVGSASADPLLQGISIFYSTPHAS